MKSPSKKKKKIHVFSFMGISLIFFISGESLMLITTTLYIFLHFPYIIVTFLMICATSLITSSIIGTIIAGIKKKWDIGGWFVWSGLLMILISLLFDYLTIGGIFWFHETIIVIPMFIGLMLVIIGGLTGKSKKTDE